MVSPQHVPAAVRANFTITEGIRLTGEMGWRGPGRGLALDGLWASISMVRGEKGRARSSGGGERKDVLSVRRLKSGKEL